MKVSRNFVLQEFVPPSIWRKNKEKSIRFIDPRIIDIAQAVRELFDEPIVINGRFMGKTYKDSGYRTPQCGTGAYYSQHKFGRAVDLKFKSCPDYNEVMKVIRANFAMLSKVGLTTMETGTDGWLHLDCRWTLTPDRLLEFPWR
jgi:hypothetical protein